jgi:hypothetical protein
MLYCRIAGTLKSQYCNIRLNSASNECCKGNVWLKRLDFLRRRSIQSCRAAPNNLSRSSLSVLNLIAGGSASVAFTVFVRAQYVPTVQCKGHSRLNRAQNVSSVPEQEVKFPWKQFFALLWPDIWYLVGAVLVSS